MESMTDRVSARARAVPASLIRRMFDLTPQVPGAISLAVGEPGFDAAAHRRGGRQALHDGFTKYSPNEGYLDLREAIAEAPTRQRLPGRPGLEVFVTVGAMEALALTFMVGSTRVTRCSSPTRATRTSRGRSRSRGPAGLRADRSGARLSPARRGRGGRRDAAHRDPGEQPLESDRRRLPARSPSRHRRDRRPARPLARLRRDVRRPDVRGYRSVSPASFPGMPRTAPCRSTPSRRSTR